MKTQSQAIAFSSIFSLVLSFLVSVGLLFNRYSLKALEAPHDSLSYKIDALTTGNNLNAFALLVPLSIGLITFLLVSLFSKEKRKRKIETSILCLVCARMSALMCPSHHCGLQSPFQYPALSVQ